MSAFLTKLAMEAADGTDSGEWILTATLEYQSDVAKMVVIIPKGFRTDLASVPRLPLVYTLAGGVGAAAAVVHDSLYESRMLPRALADAVFREASEVIGVSWFQRWLMWAAVRAAGHWHYHSD